LSRYFRRLTFSLIAGRGTGGCVDPWSGKGGLGILWGWRASNQVWFFDNSGSGKSCKFTRLGQGGVPHWLSFAISA
jgi:hypothetical protein